MGENGKFIVLRCYSGLPMRAPEMNPLSLSSHTLLLLALFRALSCLPALSTVENGRKADWKHKMAATRFESHNVGIIGASRSAERLSRLRHLVLERVAYKNEWAAVFTRRRAVLSLLHGASSNVHERKRSTLSVGVGSLLPTHTTETDCCQRQCTFVVLWKAFPEKRARSIRGKGRTVFFVSAVVYRSLAWTPYSCRLLRLSQASIRMV